MKTILLVEDNPSDIALTERAFEKHHLTNRLVVIEDGQEALDYLFGDGRFTGRNTAETPAVILLDLKLPRVGGLEVLRRIRSDARTSMLPVVVLTTSKLDRDIVESYNGGANSYVNKPVDFGAFVEAVRSLNLYWTLVNVGPPTLRPGGSAP